MSVQPKKHLGQHFLTDKNMCKKIANQYLASHNCTNVLEIGPGMGALTDFLLKRGDLNLKVMELQKNMVFTRMTITHSNPAFRIPIIILG